MSFRKAVGLTTALILSTLLLINLSTTNNNTVAAERPVKDWNVVEGFAGNSIAASATGATISGGGRSDFPNQITADFGAIGGGLDNKANGYAAVGGGSHNTAGAFHATVGGGSQNVAGTEYATVGGGYRNAARATRATVGGGYGNVAGHLDTTVGGGGRNTANNHHATVSGGSQNVASGFDATVGGGSHNTASGTRATVGGGSQNVAVGFDTTVGGGAGNAASANDASVGGGLSNRATDNYGTVSGGRANLAGNANDVPRDAWYATVGGGLENTAGGAFSSTPGGAFNRASGDYSLASGRRAVIQPDHDGAFLFADATDADFESVAANEFAVRASGGVRLVSAVDGDGRSVAGVKLAPGSGSWSSLSDSAAKANVSQVDGMQTLMALAELPVLSWNYIGQDPTVRHIGPMAQDFYAVFGVGEDERHISAVDTDGVALAAIQGLYQVVQEQEKQIAVLEARVSALERVNEGNALRIPLVLLSVGGLFTIICSVGVAVSRCALRRRDGTVASALVDTSGKSRPAGRE